LIAVVVAISYYLGFTPGHMYRPNLKDLIASQGVDLFVDVPIQGEMCQVHCLF